MNKDFDEILKKMASESKIKEPDVLRKNILKNCRQLKKERVNMKKWQIGVAASMACVVGLGVCFPTYAKELPVVKQVMEFLNEKHDVYKTDNSSGEKIDVGKTSIFTTKIEGYEINIEDVYFDGDSFLMFYSIVGEEKLDKEKTYALGTEIKGENISETEYAPGAYGFVDDNTFYGVQEILGVSEDGNDLGKVFKGSLDIKNLYVEGTGDVKTADFDSYEISNGNIELNLNADDTFIKEYNIDKAVNEGSGAMHLNKGIERRTGFFINRDEESESQFTDYLVWDTKKGELGLDGLKKLENGTLNVKYETASEDGELYVIPYERSMQKDTFDDYNRYKVEEGKKYDLGDFGTVDVKTIKADGNTVEVTAHLTGDQARDYFHLTNKSGKEYGKLLYTKNMKVNGLLDIEATYVFKNVDDGEGLYIASPKEGTGMTCDMKIDQAIKIK